MASDLPKTESLTDISRETTKSAPTAPEIPVRKFELLYDGTYGREVDIAIEGFGFVRCIAPAGYILYMKIDVPSGANTCFEEWPCPVGEYRARSFHVEPCVVEHFQTLGSIQDFLVKHKATPVGVHHMFVLIIKLACGADNESIYMPQTPEGDAPPYKKFAGAMKENRESLPKGDEQLFELVRALCVGFLYSSNANFVGPPWAMQSVQCAKMSGLVCTVGAFAMWNHNRSLSRFMIKAGAIATASGAIMALATPLPPAVGLSVGLVAWVIVVAAVLFNEIQHLFRVAWRAR